MIKVVPIYSILLWLMFSFSGCEEDVSDPVCQERQLLFKWGYHDENRNDLFEKEIKKITVYIFSADDYYIKSYEFERGWNNDLRSNSMELDPGTYKIISWANLLNRTSISPLSLSPGIRLSDFKINLDKKLLQNESYLTSDSLFHVQESIIITDALSQEYSFAFRRETCYIKVVMEDFLRVPEVKMKGMSGGYDLEGRIFPVNVQYAPGVIYDNVHSLYRAEFATLRPAVQDQLNLELYEKGNPALIYSLDLTAILRELNINTEKDDEVNLLIYLRPLQGNRISVSVNDWHIIQDINVNL